MVVPKQTDYGATQSTESDISTSSKYGFATSHKAIMVDSMNDFIIFQINEQAHNKKNGTVPARTKIHLSPPYWAKAPNVRRKSESDVISLREGLIEMEAEINDELNLNGSLTLSEEKKKRYSTKQKLILVILCIVDLTSFCALSIMAPFFPDEAIKKGINPAVSGWVFSMSALAIFISSPFMGWIVQKTGPKPLLIGGVTLTAAANIIFGFLNNIDGSLLFLSSCLIVRAFDGLGTAAFTTASFVFVAELFQDKIGSVLGLMEICVGLGMSLGPIFGGFLYDFGGYGLPFYSVGGLLLATIPLNVVILPHIIPTKYSAGSVWELLKLKPVALMAIVTTVVSIIWSYPDPILEPHLKDFNLGAKHVGLIFMASAAMSTLTSPIWGYITDNIKRTWILMVVGFLTASIGSILLGPSGFTGLQNTLWLNIVGMAVLGTSAAMAMLPTFEAMLDFAIDGGYKEGTATYGLIAGLWTSVYSLGEVIGPSLGSVLTHHYGFRMCTTIMALLCAFTATLVLVYFLFCHHDSDRVSSSKSSQTNLIPK